MPSAPSTPTAPPPTPAESIQAPSSPPAETAQSPAPPSTTDKIREILHLHGYAKSFMAEHIRALIRIFAIAGIKDAGAVELMFDIMFIDPTTVRHFRQFQGMWRHRRSRQHPYKLWWDTFRVFLRDCFDKTRTQMNHYHQENPPDPDYFDSDDEILSTETWFPGSPKMNPPSHKQETPLVIAAAPGPPRKKQKRDKMYPFKVCIVEPGDYDGPGDFPVFEPMAEWLFTGVKEVSLDTVFHAVFSLCGSRCLDLIMGCLVQPSEMLGLRTRDIVVLHDNNSVRNFFAVDGYSPLVVLAVLKEMEHGSPSGVPGTPVSPQQGTAEDTGRTTPTTPGAWPVPGRFMHGAAPTTPSPTVRPAARTPPGPSPAALLWNAVSNWAGIGTSGIRLLGFTY